MGGGRSPRRSTLRTVAFLQRQVLFMRPGLSDDWLTEHRFDYALDTIVSLCVVSHTIATAGISVMSFTVSISSSQ